MLLFMLKLPRQLLLLHKDDVIFTLQEKRILTKFDAMEPVMLRRGLVSVFFNLTQDGYNRVLAS